MTRLTRKQFFYLQLVPCYINFVNVMERAK